MINNWYAKFVFFYAFCLLLMSCGESDNATEMFENDPVADQYKTSAINVVSITNIASVRNAVLLAAKQINGAGGVLGKEYNVVAFVASGTDEAVSLAKKSLEFDIKAFNVSYSSRSKAVSELTIPAQVAIISESATSPFFTTYADNDFYFRLVPSDIIQSRILAEIAIEQGHETAITVHNDTDQYGETLVENFTTNFELLGGTVLSQIAVPFSVTTGFDEYLAVIANNHPDMILGSLIEADESANFVNESLAFGITAKYLFPDASAGISAFANNIANAESIADALGTSPGFGLATAAEMIYFNTTYQQQFKVAPDGFNVTGYDFAFITALAIEHAGYTYNTDNPSSVMVKNSLRAVMNPPGEIVGPTNIKVALQLIKSGKNVNYSGSYGANDWDENGDLSGEITYDVLSIDTKTKMWTTAFQQQLFIP